MVQLVNRDALQAVVIDNNFLRAKCVELHLKDQKIPVRISRDLNSAFADITDMAEDKVLVLIINLDQEAAPAIKSWLSKVAASRPQGAPHVCFISDYSFSSALPDRDDLVPESVAFIGRTRPVRGSSFKSPAINSVDHALVASRVSEFFGPSLLTPTDSNDASSISAVAGLLRNSQAVR